MLDNNQFNTEPYYDDFDENKKFYKILFRPATAVQARELTQLQTLLQNQIKRQGDHLFNQGAMVIPGQMSIDTKADYVKLEASYAGVVTETFIENLKGTRVVGTSGIVAEIVDIAHAEGTDNTTIYVRYVNSGTDKVTKKFADGEIIATEDLTYAVQAIASNSTGVGSIASIQRGVYYVNGYFVLCETQSILLEKYSTTPSHRIGLNVVESIITPEDDETILDNAQNSYNYAAPGAHRYFIDLVLSKRSLTDTDDSGFIELARVDEGIVKKQVRTTDYAILEQTMARRTYDESGDYTVNSFEIDVREHRNNNRGTWATSTSYLAGDVVVSGGKTYYAKNSGTSGSTTPTHTTGSVYDGSGNTGIQWEYNETPYYNRGIYVNGDESKLAIGLEPGKAYVQGYEIEKIATEYVEVDKARVFAQADGSLVPSSIGNYVLVTGIKNLPKVHEFETLSLYNKVTTSGVPSGATKLGTARVKAIEWDSGTVNSSNGIYKLFLFDVKLNAGVDFNTKVKSFVGTAFSANINPIVKQLIGSVSQAGSTAVTGNGTSFQTDLVVGDYVYLGTTLARVEGISGQQAMTVDSSNTLAGVPLSLVSTEINEPDSSSLIFPLPYYAIKSLRSSINTNDTTYLVYERFTGTTSGTGELTISTSGTFASTDENDNYIITLDSTGAVLSPTNVNNYGSSITFQLANNTAACTVVGAVIKTGSTNTEKSKTLNSTTKTITDEQTAKSGVISLGKADCYRVLSVNMRGGTFASPSGTYSIDITDRFEFDDGQRDTHYDIGTLTLKSSYAAPSAPIEITFEYFSHSSNGDYCSVNSYPANVPYGNIPSYRGYPLRDCLDFRPRIEDDGLTFNNSNKSLIPKRGTDIISDFTYYLSRTDKIAIDFTGKFFKIDGVSSLNPGVPEDAKLSMSLYTLEIEPYTFGTTSNNVKVKKIDNRRYTMRDIGKLEQRINTLEYYTSLSLLEQETSSLAIKDADNLDRFKNGFIVDNFTGHNVGDVGSPDYMCSIDMENGELRPFFTMKNVNMVEKNSNDTDRAIAGYQITGDVITLPILEHTPLVTQAYASRTEFVNPYAIFTFLGDVRLTPSSDEWFDVDRRPDILKNEEGNFNIAYMMAEKAGVLGTVWNAWQTQWTGTPTSVAGTKKTYEARGEGAWPKAEKGAIQISVAEADKRFGKLSGRPRPLRRIVTETVATKVGKSRTGTKTSIIAKIDTKVVEDKVLSTVFIPYIRSRNILVQIKKLKPNTRFYGYFDNTPISEFCTPASKIEYTISSGSFLDDTNVGGLATEPTRRVDGDTQSCLTRGDVVTGGTSGATAVVVGKEFNPTTLKTSLFVANVKGTFVSGETITGNVSTATGAITALEINTKGSALTTNFSGDLNMLFAIPNTDMTRFRTGIRELKLIDNTVATGQFSSRARVNYSAQGILETKQATVLSTRNAQLVEEQLVENNVIVETSERVVSDTGWYDPLAQTFLVESTGGAFLTKVDLFFASKDANIPVSIEIREVVNGYPGKRILPFSKVSKQSSEVNLSSSTVIDFEGVEYPDFNTPTTFVFSSPVYVQNNGEYALVVQSDSNAYKIWISQMGDTIPGSSRTISEQPYNGVMFKSQNASTWTADQNQDMKFTIYRAKFDTSSVGNVEFVNDVLPLDTLEIDPFETKVGANLVRVWHRDHGMPSGSNVIISNALAADINGIPSAELYATHEIANVTNDSYTITVSTAATSSGYGGGSVVKATKNIQYDVIQPQVQTQSFSDTSISYKIKTVSGKSNNGSQTPYTIDNSYSSVLANENNNFYSPRMLASENNEIAKLGGNDSLAFSVQLASSNNALSPVIDTHRTSVIAISNKINAPAETNTNVAALDSNLLFTGATGAYSFSGSTITTTNADVLAWYDTIVVGNYITVANATTAGNNGTYLVTSVTNNGTTGVITVSGKTFASESAASATSVTSRVAFFDEITPMGSSSISKYVSRAINLATPSTFLRVRLAANIPPEADVLVYYKTSSAGAVSNFSDINWVLSNPDSSVVKVENGDQSFYDIDYSEDNLVPFDSVAVKLVMRSTNSSAVPRIKDLRIIACA